MHLDRRRFVIANELDIVFHTTRPAWSHLKNSGGTSVINTASMAALSGIEPLGQVAQDTSAPALYLASEESSWMTGQNVCVDGGVAVGFR